VLAVYIAFVSDPNEFSGKLQGNFASLEVGDEVGLRIDVTVQWLTGKFPTSPNREGFRVIREYLQR
jgi:hypothetical protein